MNYNVQTKDVRKYKSLGYISPRRWSSYSIQVREAMLLKPEKILEIGPGNRIVTNILKDLGYHVETLDIDSRTGANYVGSITDYSVVTKLEGKFDLIIACEIFEHIEYKDFLTALQTLKKVAPKIILSLPHTELNSRFFYFNLKIPLINNLSFAKKIFYKKILHRFNGEHYWEMGTIGFPLMKIMNDIQKADWNISKHFFNPDNPYHYFFVLNLNEHENKH